MKNIVIPREAQFSAILCFFGHSEHMGESLGKIN